MKRRSFFQSLAKAAAIVALAPQLAFRAKSDVFTGVLPVTSGGTFNPANYQGEWGGWKHIDDRPCIVTHARWQEVVALLAVKESKCL